MAVLKIDTRQQAGKHDIKNEWWALHGVPTVRCKLDFGDYAIDGSNVSVDTKRNIDEIAQNINGKNHDRFKRECQRAAAAGYRLIILIENREGVHDLGALKKWTNTHCLKCGVRWKVKCNPHDMSTKCARHSTRKPIQGARLAKAMQTMSDRYGVVFEFCSPNSAAFRICRLLGIDFDWLCLDCYRYENGLCSLDDGKPREVDGKKPLCDEGVPF